MSLEYMFCLIYTWQRLLGITRCNQICKFNVQLCKIMVPHVHIIRHLTAPAVRGLINYLHSVCRLFIVTEYKFATTVTQFAFLQYLLFINLSYLYCVSKHINLYIFKLMWSIWYDRTPWWICNHIWNHLFVMSHHLTRLNIEFATWIVTCNILGCSIIIFCHLG